MLSSLRKRDVETLSAIRSWNAGTRVLVVIALLGLWQATAQFFPYYTFPGIVELFAATNAAITEPEFGAYSTHVIDTFRRLLIGFVSAVVICGPVGVLMGLRDSAEAFLKPWMILGLSIPSIVVAFALIIAIGISELVPILTVVIVGVPFVILNMWEGVQEMDPEIDEMAEFFGASRYQRARHVVLPQLLEYLFPSMYWGLVVSWKVLFIAEVFGAGSGVGYLVDYWFAQTPTRIDMILGWVLIPVILIILAQEGLRALEDRLMAWR